MKWFALLGALLLMGAARPVRTSEAGGEHIRMATDRGPVHVWVPPGYRPETAGVALYVHGYYTSVDKAWKEHRLAAQFRASGRNALFIAPEAPDGLRQKVFWPDLGDLLQEVRRQTGLRRRWGRPVVAMVHSGGYRTAAAWLDDDILDDLVLLDAMYGEEEPFRDWMRAPAHDLLVVGADTLRWTEPFARETGLRSLDAVPGDPDPGGGSVYLRSGLGHMDLVTSGKVIPVLYRMTRLPAAAAAR